MVKDGGDGAVGRETQRKVGGAAAAVVVTRGPGVTWPVRCHCHAPSLETSLVSSMETVLINRCCVLPLPSRMIDGGSRASNESSMVTSWHSSPSINSTPFMAGHLDSKPQDE
ncbi:hypothetical protein SCLCIDRAFT_1126625 [Scleroderma citrinum Foug A]|uniref:Uncharacterized protein n=1 Tax=Scleroderma citrinum Foug A TaxID=1036808 RepID=A0A0C2Z6K0_9AGAM|nr:hypothetical protein SCLCIDRAFT_1126625 [Scleroderma citrinum Foug A]